MLAFLRLFLKFYLALNSYIFIIKKALLFSILLSRIMVKMARIVKDTISCPNYFSARDGAFVIHILLLNEIFFPHLFNVFHIPDVDFQLLFTLRAPGNNFSSCLKINISLQPDRTFEPSSDFRLSHHGICRNTVHLHSGASDTISHLSFC